MKPESLIKLIFPLVLCLALSGCSALEVRPMAERTYTFNDLDQAVDVRYAQPPAMIAKAVAARESLTRAVTRRLPGARAQVHPQVALQQSVGASVDYLAKNQLSDVVVRVNEYSPRAEFQRVRANQQIARPLKYTLGLVSVAKYAMVPSALTKKDSFNPYSNTLHLNSGQPVVAVEQAAVAKDLRQKKMPELYLLSQKLPGGNLPGIKYKTSEVINYYSMYGSPEQQQNATETMTTRYASQIGSEIADFVPGTDPIFRLAGSVAGKVVGKAINQHR